MRPTGFLDKLAVSVKTAAPDPKLGQELTKMLVDDLTVIPIYYVNEMYILQPNVRDSGPASALPIGIPTKDVKVSQEATRARYRCGT